MPTVTLIPWTTEEVNEFGNVWAFAGTPAEALRAVSDGKHAVSSILGGGSDSNPLRGKLWRLASGVAFNWALKTITNIAVRVNINNNGPESSSFLAIVTANETLAYAEQVFNGEIFTPVGVPTWLQPVNSNHANIKAAILADNFLISIVHYNHIFAGHTLIAEASEVVVTYTDNVPMATMIAMEV